MLVQILLKKGEDLKAVEYEAEDDSVVFKKLSNEEMLLKVVDEIVTTEVKYVEDLRVIRVPLSSPPSHFLLLISSLVTWILPHCRKMPTSSPKLKVFQVKMSMTSSAMSASWRSSRQSF